MEQPQQTMMSQQNPFTVSGPPMTGGGYPGPRTYRKKDPSGPRII